MSPWPLYNLYRPERNWSRTTCWLWNWHVIDIATTSHLITQLVDRLHYCHSLSPISTEGSRQSPHTWSWGFPTAIAIPLSHIMLPPVIKTSVAKMPSGSWVSVGHCLPLQMSKASPLHMLTKLTKEYWWHWRH